MLWTRAVASLQSGLHGQEGGCPAPLLVRCHPYPPQWPPVQPEGHWLVATSLPSMVSLCVQPRSGPGSQVTQLPIAGGQFAFPDIPGDVAADSKARACSLGFSSSKVGGDSVTIVLCGS